LKPNDATSLNQACALLPNLPPGSEILIVRLRSLGDLVLETSAIAALHSWRPDLRISILLEPRFAAVFEGNPAVAEVIFSPRKLLRTILDVRSRRFAAAFNQHGGPRSALITAFSGASWRVGWARHQFSFIHTVQVPEAKEFYGKPAVHTVEHRLSQFYWTGLPRGPIPAAQLYPQTEALESAASFLRQKGIEPSTPYAVLQPGARLPEMRWPAAKFAEIARWLRETYGILSVVNAGLQEAEALPEIHRAMQKDAVIPDSALDLRMLIALVAGCRIFIGNDSGPAHVAAALQRPSVVIFSVTDPVQWHPWQAPYRIVHTGATFDHPRGDKAVVTSNPRPISSIDVGEIQAACEDLFCAHSLEDKMHRAKH
jgi:heptosyltransferase III